MEFIGITKEVIVSNEGRPITQLFENGLPLLHLRKPEASKEDLENLIGTIPEKYHPQIIIHQHYSLQNTFSLKGIHLPEKIRKTADNIDKKVISTSYHRLSDLLNAPESQFEYVFLSPVYDSISKKGHQSSFSDEELTKALKNTSIKVIGLGGISPRNFQKLKKMGFKGGAAIGSLWNGDPVKNLEAFLDKISE